jgi:hypothetical protein
VPDAKFTAAIASATTPDLTISHQVFLVDFFRVGATVDVDAELKGNAEWRKACGYPDLLYTGTHGEGDLACVLHTYPDAQGRMELRWLRLHDGA